MKVRKRKRLFDVFTTLILLILLVIPIVFLILVIRYYLGRPVFFTQLRPGKHGKIFKILKFRTMTDARDLDGNLLSDAERITPFGSWLRSRVIVP